MKQYLTLAFIALLFAQCTEEKIEIQELEIEKEFSWESHPNFQYDNAIQINSFANDQFCFFMGINSMSSMVEEGTSHPSSILGGHILHYNLDNQHPLYAKFPICDTYCVTESARGNQWISLKPNLSPILIMGSKTSWVDINIAEIDPYFMKVSHIHSNNGESILMNNNQTLVMYQTTIEKNSRLRALLIDVNITKERTNYILDTLKTQILEFGPYHQFQESNYSFDGSFYICPSSEETYRISKAGQLTKVVNAGFKRLFKYDNVLVGFSFSNSDAYISTDNGQTWKNEFKVPIPELYLLSYTKINDKLVGFYNSQVFEISFSDGFKEYTIKELDNYGLEGKKITSLSMFNKKVYTTTLSGVFTRDIDDFFTEKILKEDAGEE